MGGKMKDTYNILGKCEGRDLNPRTPAGTDLESVSVNIIRVSQKLILIKFNHVMIRDRLFDARLQPRNNRINESIDFQRFISH